MRYINSPLTFRRTEHGVAIERNIDERITMMDNLVELIAFTSRGSFNADPDFGLEYWNHEYSNVSDTQFNNNNSGRDEFYKESTKERCEASIAESLIAYAPKKLKVRDIKVTMNLKDDILENNRNKVQSHHEVVIFVTAKLDDGMGTTCDYNREVSFMVEPTTRKSKY